MIAGFLAEGVPQAALVMGVILGLVAVTWAILLGRFVFTGTGDGDELEVASATHRPLVTRSRELWLW